MTPMTPRERRRIERSLNRVVKEARQQIRWAEMASAANPHLPPIDTGNWRVMISLASESRRALAAGDWEEIWKLNERMQQVHSAGMAARAESQKGGTD